MFQLLNFNHFDSLAFITGTGTLTATGTPLINSAVLVALLVLLTKLVEWRIKVRQGRKESALFRELAEAKNKLADALKENNRLLRKVAGEPEPTEGQDKQGNVNG